MSDRVRAGLERLKGLRAPAADGSTTGTGGSEEGVGDFAGRAAQTAGNARAFGVREAGAETPSTRSQTAGAGVAGPVGQSGSFTSTGHGPGSAATAAAWSGPVETTTAHGMADPGQHHEAGAGRHADTGPPAAARTAAMLAPPTSAAMTADSTPPTQATTTGQEQPQTSGGTGRAEASLPGLSSTPATATGTATGLPGVDAPLVGAAPVPGTGGPAAYPGLPGMNPDTDNTPHTTHTDTPGAPARDLHIDGAVTRATPLDGVPGVIPVTAQPGLAGAAGAAGGAEPAGAAGRGGERSAAPQGQAAPSTATPRADSVPHGGSVLRAGQPTPTAKAPSLSGRPATATESGRLETAGPVGAEPSRGGTHARATAPGTFAAAPGAVGRAVAAPVPGPALSGGAMAGGAVPGGGWLPDAQVERRWEKLPQGEPSDSAMNWAVARVSELVHQLGLRPPLVIDADAAGRPGPFTAQVERLLQRVALHVYAGDTPAAEQAAARGVRALRAAERASQDGLGGARPGLPGGAGPIRRGQAAPRPAPAPDGPQPPAPGEGRAPAAGRIYQTPTSRAQHRWGQVVGLVRDGASVVLTQHHHPAMALVPVSDLGPHPIPPTPISTTDLRIGLARVAGQVAGGERFTATYLDVPVMAVVPVAEMEAAHPAAPPPTELPPPQQYDPVQDAHQIAASAAQTEWPAILKRVTQDHQRFVITQAGRPVMALVSAADHHTHHPATGTPPEQITADYARRHLGVLRRGVADGKRYTITRSGQLPVMVVPVTDLARLPAPDDPTDATTHDTRPDAPDTTTPPEPPPLPSLFTGPMPTGEPTGTQPLIEDLPPQPDPAIMDMDWIAGLTTLNQALEPDTTNPTDWLNWPSRPDRTADTTDPARPTWTHPPAATGTSGTGPAPGPFFPTTPAGPAHTATAPTSTPAPPTDTTPTPPGTTLPAPPTSGEGRAPAAGRIYQTTSGRAYARWGDVVGLVRDGASVVLTQRRGPAMALVPVADLGPHPIPPTPISTTDLRIGLARVAGQVAGGERFTATDWGTAVMAVVPVAELEAAHPAAPPPTELPPPQQYDSVQDAHQIATSAARAEWPAILKRVTQDHQRFVITQAGRRVMALISAADHPTHHPAGTPTEQITADYARHHLAELRRGVADGKRYTITRPGQLPVMVVPVTDLAPLPAPDDPTDATTHDTRPDAPDTTTPPEPPPLPSLFTGPMPTGEPTGTQPLIEDLPPQPDPAIMDMDWIAGLTTLNQALEPDTTNPTDWLNWPSRPDRTADTTDPARPTWTHPPAATGTSGTGPAPGPFFPTTTPAAQPPAADHTHRPGSPTTPAGPAHTATAPTSTPAPPTDTTPTPPGTTLPAPPTSGEGRAPAAGRIYQTTSGRAYGQWGDVVGLVRDGAHVVLTPHHHPAMALVPVSDLGPHPIPPTPISMVDLQHGLARVAGQVAGGERFTVTDRNVPVMAVVPVAELEAAHPAAPPPTELPPPGKYDSVQDAHQIAASAARAEWPAILKRVTQDHQRFVITQAGRRVMALVSAADHHTHHPATGTPPEQITADYARRHLGVLRRGVAGRKRYTITRPGQLPVMVVPVTDLAPLPAPDGPAGVTTDDTGPDDLDTTTPAAGVSPFFTNPMPADPLTDHQPLSEVLPPQPDSAFMDWIASLTTPNQALEPDATNLTDWPSWLSWAAATAEPGRATWPHPPAATGSSGTSPTPGPFFPTSTTPAGLPAADGARRPGSPTAGTGPAHTATATTSTLAPPEPPAGTRPTPPTPPHPPRRVRAGPRRPAGSTRPRHSRHSAGGVRWWGWSGTGPAWSSPSDAARGWPWCRCQTWDPTPPRRPPSARATCMAGLQGWRRGWRAGSGSPSSPTRAGR
ncbi:hypothetical protein [Streptomyces sp. NBC_00151]|uniref:hypothetical protein n=1 Tax=Streptomyces sp. NBC_00151 TaxID=2975669 RepID=UPI002DDB1370|nr:hypothetical protein [Streptomyces sp. NBC_00151]WRZ36691.1 hypothetical protein OG915_00400 [Streptomyces sp. NBC_00151]